MSSVAKSVPPAEFADVEAPDVSGIVTEDDVPVDNFASEKQQRLLTEPLYTSWSGPPALADLEEPSVPRTFVAAANVGVFSQLGAPPLVPDVFLSLDVKLDPDLWKKENRTYFVWEMGKPPTVAIEIVSNREGGELSTKRHKYARMGVAYYVVWDPQGIYGEPNLRAFARAGELYLRLERLSFPSIGLSLVLWEGDYEGVHAVWLRWADLDGTLIPTGAERAESAQARADAAQARAEEAQARAERLAEKLRALGVDPNGDA